tara:strand:- start:512 stop:745 length:234 start_codon:yes stop_codon:yes gene_type:complete
MEENKCSKNEEYFPKELKSLFDEKLKKLDNVIFKEIRVINTMLTREYQKVTLESEKKLQDEKVRNERMHAREIVRYK